MNFFRPRFPGDDINARGWLPYWSTLISVSLALSQTQLLHWETTDTGLVHRAQFFVIIFTSGIQYLFLKDVYSVLSCFCAPVECRVAGDSAENKT